MNVDDRHDVEGTGHSRARRNRTKARSREFSDKERGSNSDGGNVTWKWQEKFWIRLGNFMYDEIKSSSWINAMAARRHVVGQYESVRLV